MGTPAGRRAVNGRRGMAETRETREMHEASDARPATRATRESTNFGREPLWRLGDKGMRRQLKHIRDQVAVVSEQSGVEDIHQMRVAIRRLRAMAEVLESTPAFRRKRLSRLRDRLQPLAQRLGAVRDLDMLLESLDEYERSAVETSQTSSALRDELHWRREKALQRLRKELRRLATRRLLQRPRRTIRRLVRRNRDARRVLVRHVAGDALWKRYEVILRFEETIEGFAPTEELHALRIACKQLRYALELFSEETDPCAQSLLETLKGVQGHLGDLQDSVFAVATLTRLRHDYPHNYLLEGFRAAQETRRNTLRQEFAPLWERISGAPYRQDLAALIAAL